MGAAGTQARLAQPVPRPKPERLAALTRLRVLLIGWVLVYHLELALRAFAGVPLAEPVVLKGYLGVDGFFVLSGFALFLGYRHRPPLGIVGWADFARRRAARIFPLHLAALTLLLILVLAAMAMGVRVNDPQRFGAWEFAMQALLANAWETTRTHAWNYPSWALSAIWAGYLVFPLLLPPMLRQGRIGCCVIAAGCLAALGWLGSGADRAQLNLTLHLGLVRFGVEFLLGIAMARLVTLRALGTGVAAAGILLIPVGVALSVDAVVVGGLAALVARLGMAIPPADAPRDLLWRLGEASFGIYLSWVFIEFALVLVLRIAEPGQGLRMALLVAGLAASLVTGWLAWRLVEVPAARWLSRATP